MLYINHCKEVYLANIQCNQNSMNVPEVQSCSSEVHAGILVPIKRPEIRLYIMLFWSQQL